MTEAWLSGGLIGFDGGVICALATEGRWAPLSEGLC